MEDIRISIRLTKEEHVALKIISAKSGISIQDMMSKEIKKIIEKGKYEEKND
jgi:predicted DNA binding CopG/RHH family protein